MKNPNVVRNYYVLPCCLLLLNLCVEIVSYKARMFGDPLLRTAAIMAVVLFGGSLIGFLWRRELSRSSTHCIAAAGRAVANSAHCCFSWCLASWFFGSTIASIYSARSRCCRAPGGIGRIESRGSNHRRLRGRSRLAVGAASRRDSEPTQRKAAPPWRCDRQQLAAYLETLEFFG